MPILSLLAKLGLDKTGFDAGLTAANKQVAKFGTGLKGQLAGAFSAAAMVAFTKSIIDLGGKIKDTMDRLGVGARDVQEFGLAAKLGGQDAEIFARSMEKIRLAMVKGVGEGKNPLAIFGITMEDLRAGDAAGVLRKLAVELENFAGSADQTKALADVFGAKGMGGVINMLRELRNAKGGDLLMSNEEVEMLDRAGDATTRLWNNLKLIGARFITSPFGLGGFFGDRPEAKETTSVGTEGFAAQQEAAEKAAEELAEVESKTAEQIEKNRIAQMTDEERLNDLLSRRIELIKELGFALTKEAEAAIQLKIAQNVGEQIALQGRVKTDKAKKGFSIEESSMGRIGAFTGASAQAGISGAQMQQIDKLAKIHDALVRQGIIIRDLK